MMSIVAGVVVWSLMDTHSQESLAMHTGHGAPRTGFTDDRKLVGFADNVLFGTVLSRDGQTEEYGWPETQYSVRVLESLKGKVAARNIITINEAGGTCEDGTPYRVEGGHNLQEVGEHYFFATCSFPARGWHTLVPRHGRIRIDVGGKTNDILTHPDTVTLRNRFTDAVQDEIPFDAATYQAGKEPPSDSVGLAMSDDKRRRACGPVTSVEHPIAVLHLGIDPWPCAGAAQRPEWERIPA